MKSEIKVPAMGESVVEAVIGRILAQEGEIVKTDAEILELETDKVNQVLYAPQEGKLSLFVKTGETVKIGQVIGEIEAAEKKEQAVEKPAAAPPPPALPKESEDKEPPLRVTKEAFLKELQEPSPAPSFQVEKKENQEKRETRRPLSNIRRLIASRLVEAKQTTAMLTTFNEIDLSQVIEWREKHQEEFIKKHGTKLGFMSFFVKATVSALQAYPLVNAYIDGGEIVERHYYDIGIAVGTERGTVVPVIRGCDQLSFAGIEQAIDDFAKKAKEGTIGIENLQGGSFTITNGGVYGSLLSTPILNPPQSGILGMHKIEKRPVVVNDQVVIRPMMYVALSYDHRIVDGKDSVSFLVHIKNRLEHPSRLLFDL